MLEYNNCFNDIDSERRDNAITVFSWIFAPLKVKRASNATVKMEKQVHMKIVGIELKQQMRVSEHIIIKIAILKIVLSQIIIITQRECNVMTLRSIFFIGHMDTFCIYEPFNFRVSVFLRPSWYVKKTL